MAPNDRDDHGRKVPIWNGSPETFEHYRDEIRIWLLGTPSSEDYSLAARLVSHLKGPARRIGLNLTDEELTPTKAVAANEEDAHGQPALQQMV